MIHSSSRKGIISENDYNIKYILNKGLKNNNLSKTINIQTPMLNINNFVGVNNFNQNNKIKKTNQKKIKNNKLHLRSNALNKKDNYHKETILDAENNNNINNNNINNKNDNNKNNIINNNINNVNNNNSNNNKFDDPNFDMNKFALTDSDLLDLDFDEALIEIKGHI